MKSKVWYLLISIVVTSILITACGAPATNPPAATQAPTEVATEAPATEASATEPSAATEAATQASGEPIKIGASLPLTGDFSEPGSAAKLGYELWVEQVNNGGGLLGRPVEMTIYDNASDPDTAVADYERLITEDKVDLVVGPFSSRLVIPTSEVAAKYGYAFPEPAGGAPDVFNRGLTNIFFCQPAPGADQALPFAEYILALPEDQRPKTFAVVSADDPFNLGVVEKAEELLTAGGLESVMKEVYPPDTKDFSAIAAKVADLNPDLILGGTIFEDSVAQIQAYQAAGYQPRGAFFTTGPSLPKEFSEALGDSTEGIFSAISWFEESTIETNPEFVAAFHAKNGDDPIAEDSANAYTVGQVLQQAIESTQSVDNAKLIDEMHSATFTTVVGPLKFDDVGRPQGSFMILQWQGGKYVIVYPDFAKQADPVWPKPEW
jgi:branched-chain amino acid transport system substrate-binding protein